MIPKFGSSGCLPPFIGNDPSVRDQRSPYSVSSSDFVARFARSPERRRIAKGLFKYREKLRSLGFETGVQWLDGSFVEDCEMIQGRPPRDIDVITMAMRPASILNDVQWNMFVENNISIFDQEHMKKLYDCHGFFIDLEKRPLLVVGDATYFYGLFSHQRYTFYWKGMLSIDLRSDDEVAQNLLEEAADDKAI